MLRSLTTVIAIIWISASAQALVVPPPGFDSWVAHGGNYGFNPSTNGQPVIEGAVGSLDIKDRADPHWAGSGIFQIGGGTVTPNSMAAFSSSNAGFHQVTTTLQDTYTLSGPSGPVDINVILSAEADAKRLALPIGVFSGVFQLIVGIGNGISSDGTEFDSIDAVGAKDELPQGIGPLDQHLSVEVVRSMTVMANEPFGIAYRMVLFSAGAAEGNALNTAVIGFDIPFGYTITSELGWTAIPEPAGLMLMGIAAGVLSLGTRCRRST